MLGDLAFGLSKLDEQVHIITSRLNYSDETILLPVKEIINNVTIHRIWTTRFGRSHLPGRAIDYLTFYLSSMLKLFSVIKTDDVVVAKTDPPMVSIPISIIAKMRDAKQINWLQDLFPEVAVNLGVKLPGFFYRLLKKIRNYSLLTAKANVVIGELMKNKLKENGIPEKKIVVIQNWADENSIHPVDHEINMLRKEWGLGEKFVVGYSGNLGRAHDFSAILSAAKLLKDKSDIVFLFIGDGAQKEKLKEFSSCNNLNMLFKPYQSAQKIAESLSVSDLHIVTLKPELEGLIVPSKFYGIQAAGRAVLFLGDKEGEVANLINKSDCGFCLDPDSERQIANTILKCYEDQGLVNTMGRNGRLYFEEQQFFETAVREWKQITA